MILSDRHTPRWIIFFIDLTIGLFSFVLAYYLRFNFTIPSDELERLSYAIPLVVLVKCLSFLSGKTYAGVIRYTGSKDAERVFLVVTAGSVALALTNIATYFSAFGMFVIPYSIVIIDYVTTVFLMTAYRIAVKTLYLEITNPAKAKSSMLIFGAGTAGVITKRTLDRDAGSKYNVSAFVDDDPKKAGKTLEGVKIYHSAKLDEVLSNNKITQVIISAHNMKAARKQDLVDICIKHNIRVLTLPPVNRWIKGELSYRQIKRIKIEDLLERDPIKLDEDRLTEQLKGKRMLVTGGAGSIGSEIARQIIRYNPSKLILLDQAESPLYDLELELGEKYHLTNFEMVLGDIRNEARMENLFNTYKPELVYHAAAYKHVPAMENNPSEAVLVNVLGTRIIADLAVKHGVKKFVYVSTDKAVNPTNVMGASKRIAEIYTQSLSKHQNVTKFITTRFGNVLGSNGSVILRFKKQIDEGGPVTVTDPEVSRYFMTIPEACQLVLEAGAMGEGGEIFIFDMGESIKVDDLAKKMIKLSKLTLDKDIQLVYTGLRPGEKLKEELLNSDENTKQTHHPKIMIAKVREYDWETIYKETDKLIDLFKFQNNDAIVKKMKQMVPEFISSNSVYEKLDKIVGEK